MMRRPAFQKASNVAPKKVSGRNPIGLGRDQASSSGTLSGPITSPNAPARMMNTTIATSSPTTHRQRGESSFPVGNTSIRWKTGKISSTQDQLSNQSRSQSPGVKPWAGGPSAKRSEGDVGHTGGEDDETGDHQQQPDDVSGLTGHDQRPGEDENRGKQRPRDAIQDEEQ